RIGTEISARVQFAWARWNLEAWYFADVVGLRGYIERAPGSFDASKPDEIQNRVQQRRRESLADGRPFLVQFHAMTMRLCVSNAASGLEEGANHDRAVLAGGAGPRGRTAGGPGVCRRAHQVVAAGRPVIVRRNGEDLAAVVPLEHL